MSKQDEWREVRQRLAHRLAERRSAPDTIGRLLDSAGIQYRGAIHSVSPLDVWHGILSDNESSPRFPNLLNVLANEGEGDPVLIGLIDRARALTPPKRGDNHTVDVRPTRGDGNRRRFVAVVSTIAVTLAVVIGVTLLLTREVGVGVGVPTPTAASTSSGSQATSDVAAAVAVGACLAAGKTVACDSPHEFEVIAKATCRQADLLQYLGADPAVDIVGADLGLEPGPQGTCVVKPPATLSTSLRNALLGSVGTGRWRVCFDSGTGWRTTACDAKHTAELVYLRASTDLTPLDCQARAQTYLGTSMTQVKDYLEVQPLDWKGQQGCAVAVRGGANVLTDTVRRLGTRAIESLIAAQR
ncbi:MAG: hypothetical protein ACOYBY_15920 [Dermatophilaceae bacterium]